MEDAVTKLDALVARVEKSPKHLTKQWSWERPWEEGYRKVDFTLARDLREAMNELMAERVSE